jgi:hypothetical protein
MSQTNSMLRSPTPESKISSGNQYKPPRYMEHQDSSHFSTERTTRTYREPAEPSPRKHTIFFLTKFIKHAYVQVATFRCWYQGPWTYFPPQEHVLAALPISLFRLLFSTILCIQRFRDICVHFGGSCGWENVRTSVTCC